MSRLALVFCSPVICLSVCPSVHLSFCQSVRSTVFLSVCPFLCLSLWLSISLSLFYGYVFFGSSSIHMGRSVFLFVHLRVFVSHLVNLCPSRLSASLSICQSFLSSLFRFVGLSVFLSIIIWLYQVSWKWKLATVTSYKADVSRVSPSSEQMFRSDEGLTLETSAL